MDAYQIYQNFIELFSSSDEERYEALLFKKEWILDKFYVPYTFDYANGKAGREIECLIHFMLPFRQLTTLSVETKESINAVKKFNDKYRRLKIYHKLPRRYHKDTFFVEIDFKKLDRDDYKVLVASFFPCLELSEFKDKYPLNDLRTRFKYAIEGYDDSSLLLLDKKYLSNDAYKVDGFTKIYIYDDISDSNERKLRQIAKYLNLKVVEVHGGENSFTK